MNDGGISEQKRMMTGNDMEDRGKKVKRERERGVGDKEEREREGRETRDMENKYR